MREAARVACGALLLAAALVGCVPGADPGAGPGSDPTASTSAPGTGSTPTEIPSWLLECGADDGKDQELQLADLDLTTATWATPPGFEVSTSYVEDNPVERIHSTWYAVPTDPVLPSLNVVQVVVYVDIDWGDLADECGRVPIAAVEEKLARYREQIGAEPLSEARTTELAGHPAIRQDIGLDRYSYAGWWLFSSDQLLHLYCQWTPDGDREVIERGCDDLVASLAVG